MKFPENSKDYLIFLFFNLWAIFLFYFFHKDSFFPENFHKLIIVKKGQKVEFFNKEINKLAELKYRLKYDCDAKYEASEIKNFGSLLFKFSFDEQAEIAVYQFNNISKKFPLIQGESAYFCQPELINLLNNLRKISASN